PQRPIEVIAPDGSATIEARALQPPVSAGADKGINQAAAISGGAASGGSLVASKSGSAYHLLNCPGAKQIKEENKVYFATEGETARDFADYTRIIILRLANKLN
ncbi:MAG: hypothetical protein UY75_C0023G0006, partial [Parcubacteria group bacterium GW2011_GWC2_52_8c]